MDQIGGQVNTVRAHSILNPSALLALDTKPFERIPFVLKSQGRPRFHAMMNALASCLEDEIFLEVGSYQGGSMIGTLLNNKAHGWAVEDFSEFNGNLVVDNTRETLEKNLKTFDVFDRVIIHQAKFEAFFEAVVIPPVGLYYYDANHGRSSTYAGLALGLSHVIDGGFMVIDDIAWDGVTAGVNDFLGKFPDQARVVFASNVTQPPDLSPEWWNGIIVLQRMIGIRN